MRPTYEISTHVSVLKVAHSISDIYELQRRCEADDEHAWYFAKYLTNDDGRSFYKKFVTNVDEFIVLLLCLNISDAERLLVKLKVDKMLRREDLHFQPHNIIDHENIVDRLFRTKNYNTMIWRRVMGVDVNAEILNHRILMVLITLLARLKSRTGEGQKEILGFFDAFTSILKSLTINIAVNKSMQEEYFMIFKSLLAIRGGRNLSFLVAFQKAQMLLMYSFFDVVVNDLPTLETKEEFKQRVRDFHGLFEADILKNGIDNQVNLTLLLSLIANRVNLNQLTCSGESLSIIILNSSYTDKQKVKLLDALFRGGESPVLVNAAGVTPLAQAMVLRSVPLVTYFLKKMGNLSWEEKEKFYHQAYKDLIYILKGVEAFRIYLQSVRADRETLNSIASLLVLHSLVDVGHFVNKNPELLATVFDFVQLKNIHREPHEDQGRSLLATSLASCSQQISLLLIKELRDAHSYPFSIREIKDALNAYKLRVVKELMSGVRNLSAVIKPILSQHDLDLLKELYLLGYRREINDALDAILPRAQGDYRRFLLHHCNEKNVDDKWKEVFNLFRSHYGLIQKAIFFQHNLLLVLTYCCDAQNEGLLELSKNEMDVIHFYLDLEVKTASPITKEEKQILDDIVAKIETIAYWKFKRSFKEYVHIQEALKGERRPESRKVLNKVLNIEYQKSSKDQPILDGQGRRKLYFNEKIVGKWFQFHSPTGITGDICSAPEPNDEEYCRIKEDVAATFTGKTLRAT